MTKRNAQAPYQVNFKFRNNDIGKIVIANAATGGDNGTENGNGNGNGGDTVQINKAAQEQDVNQANVQEQTGVVGQETGDTFALSFESGPGDSLAIAGSDHNQKGAVDQIQEAKNKNKQNLKQENDSE
ncbi:hypothetical protein HNQ94_002983 [Salirhabdus euzebyi]|uniref:Uncharacterized protein n=1 Tax=Salirhabdus euzebyi TaxID=394506 RepID=A0A841Q7T6_9BACI|nr:hypothetical protein [Salirhabdus euzebyi]MBB6454501.1 hypothetical protein [Salirhabdus euzebyi]